MKTFNWKKCICVIILFLLALFLSYKIIDMIFYDYMFVVNMEEDGKYAVTNSYNNGVSFELVKNGEYFEANIPSDITGYDIELKLKLNEDEKRIEEVIYNNKVLEQKNIIKLNDITNYDLSYQNMPLFMINRNPTKKIIVVLIVALIETVIMALILKNEKWENITYSKSFLKTLNKKDIIILIAVFAITAFITVGCDAKVIANVGNLFAKDVDIYQLQVNTKLITGREYAEFPYNPLMLCIWGGIMTIFRPITKILPIISNYPYFEVAVLKLFNLGFIFLTISSIISFLLDNKIIDEKRAKWIYYLSLFNPVVFYVAILFVQLDALTLYLVVTGTLLLNNLNKDKFLGIVYLSIGLMLKMQIIFLIPTALIAILYIIFYCSKEKIGTKIVRTCKCAGIFIGISLFTFAIPYLLKTPFYYLESNLGQSDRLWYTVLQYTGDIYFYFALGSLAIAMIIYVLNIHSKIEKEKMILSSIIYYAVIIFLFSFAILPTPSIYIVTLGAWAILVALEKDKLKNIILTLVSVLIIVCPMFSDYGDISKIGKNPDEQGIITKYIQTIPERKDLVKTNSIIFTISASSMLIFAIYMGKESIKLINKNN